MHCFYFFYFFWRSCWNLPRCPVRDCQNYAPSEVLNACAKVRRGVRHTDLPRLQPQSPPHSNTNTNTTSTSTSTSILLTYHLPAQPPSISSLSLFRTNTLFCYQRQPPQPSSLSFRLVFVTHHRANATPTLTRPRRVSPNTPTQINSNHPREPPNRLPTTTHSSQSATTTNNQITTMTGRRSCKSFRSLNLQ
jgi:hypothetical protein